MVEDRKSTPKEELKWRAEFKTLGREVVHAKSSDFRPYIKRDLGLNGIVSADWHCSSVARPLATCGW
jgi:hypothetical protein